MNKVYVTGSSLICALGDEKQKCVEKVKSFEQNTPTTQKDVFDIFRIDTSFKTHKEKFYHLLNKAIIDAINDANLNLQEQEELCIFIGSTAHSISLIEEVFKDYYEKRSEEEFNKIGYGDIGTYIEELIKSKYKTTIIQTACTSTSNALSYASRYMQQNKIKKALIVGFEVFNKSTYEGFNSLMLLSKSKIYRPFDCKSDGLILGESFSCMVLETQKRKDDDFEILASNIEFDNSSITGSNPSGEQTFRCMQKAIKKANLSVKDLTCIKAHATGSENSNTSEARAIDSLFESANSSTDVVILKPFVGHTLGACGATEIVLLTQLIKNGFLPKTLNYESGYEEIKFKPLLEKKEVKNATVLFQFIGFGGSNSSIILSNKGES